MVKYVLRSQKKYIIPDLYYIWELIQIVEIFRNFIELQIESIEKFKLTKDCNICDLNYNNIYMYQFQIFYADIGIEIP